MNVKVLQEILGHKDISTTLNIYTDVTKDTKKREISALGDYFEKMSIWLLRHTTPICAGICALKGNNADKELQMYNLQLFLYI